MRVSERPEVCGTSDQPRDGQRLCGAILDLRRVAREIAGLGVLEHDLPAFERIIRDGIRRDLAQVAGMDARGLGNGSIVEAAVSLLAARAGSLRAAERTVSTRVRVMPQEDRSRTILESMRWL